MLVEHLDPIEIYAAGIIVYWAWGIYHQSVGHSAIPADTCSAESKLYGGKDASPAGHSLGHLLYHHPIFCIIIRSSMLANVLVYTIVSMRLKIFISAAEVPWMGGVH
eukprot:scaffold194_cov84-Skeletonema_dohrnii-CCMP3373.AAC.3